MACRSLRLGRPTCDLLPSALPGDLALRLLDLELLTFNVTAYFWSNSDRFLLTLGQLDGGSTGELGLLQVDPAMITVESRTTIVFLLLQGDPLRRSSRSSPIRSSSSANGRS